MQRDNSVTVAVATSCTRIFTETFLGLSSIVSVEFRVQEFTTATVTQHSRNTQCSNGTETCCMPSTEKIGAAKTALAAVPAIVSSPDPALKRGKGSGDS